LEKCFLKIIILGPPGSGKGTQSKELSRRLEIAHVSTGDILREEVKANTPLGQRAKAYLDSGTLVPDALVIEMLGQRLFGQSAANRGFILDGFPRTLKQAEALDELLAKIPARIDLVFYLDATESVIIQRLSGRRICSQCAAIYHIKNMPPKKEGICDKCAGALYQRSDDKPETIKNRLRVYLEQTAALIDYYKKENVLFYIDANKEAEIVIQQMLEKINSYLHDHTKV